MPPPPQPPLFWNEDDEDDEVDEMIDEGLFSSLQVVFDVAVFG